MILVTGANGRTGRAVINALLSKGEQVRAFVHKAEQIQEIKSLGTIEAVAGDMMDQKAVNDAFNGVHAVYHICSAVNPYEVQIKAAHLAKVEQFVCHSVLHSVLQDMPHHQKKLIHIYVPYFLLSYGKSIQIIEPQSLKEKLVAVASELMEYYQL
ncbi:MAG: NAD(P)H-binding protein [Lacrimispora sphenoides]